MGAKPYESSATGQKPGEETNFEQWDVHDIANLKQQLNEAVFLGRFMGAISTTFDPSDICSIASRWLYDHIPYLRIIFALSPNLLCQPLVYSPGVGRDISIDPTILDTMPYYTAEHFRNLSISTICTGDEITCRRYTMELAEGLGFIVLYVDPASSGRFSECFLANLQDNFSHALKNALEHNKLKELAMRDSLTGLFNRRVFDEMLEIEGRRQELMPLSLLMIDLDDFKLANDRFGHQAGDQVLAKFGKILRDNCRGSDLVARYGGEEFAVMLPATTSTIAFEIARRLRTRLAETTFVFDGTPARFSASIGIAYTTDTGKPGADLVRRADQALYRAKKGGKNRTCVYAAKPVEFIKTATSRRPACYALLQPEFQVRTEG